MPTLYIRMRLLLFTLALLPFMAQAQTKAAQKEAIRQAFKQINSNPHLTKRSLKNEAFLGQATDGGSELTGFYNNGQLVKLVSWIGLSEGNKVVEYYFKDSALIFVYGQFNAWVFDAERDEFDHSKTRTIFEGRYYFHQNKMLEQLTKGSMHADDEAYYQPANLQATARNYAALLNK